MGQPPRLTPEQLAAMTPEQRQKWEQMLRSRQQLQPSPEEMARLKTLSAEAHVQLQHENMPDIPMSDEDRNKIENKIRETVGNMLKIGKGFSKWYAITHDDARAKMYFRTVSFPIHATSCRHPIKKRNRDTNRNTRDYA